VTKQKKTTKLTAGEKELQNLLKRVQADFENYKKRAHREKEEFVRYANSDLILQLLPILDNFQLAIKHLPKELEGNSWVEGIRHIETQFEQILKSEGVTKIPTYNEKYDPYLHEAVEEVISKKPRGEITEEVLTGYKLKDKVIRHSKVKVSQGETIKKGEKK